MESAQAATRMAGLTNAAEWRRTQPTARDVDQDFERHLTTVDRIALWVTDNVGSMGFFTLIAVWTVIWLSWNTIGPAELRFDPGPAFLMWLFISNVLQLHLMPLIMVGQNLQDRYSEARAQADYEVSLKAEAEVEALLGHVTSQNDVLLEILRRIEGLEKSGAAAR